MIRILIGAILIAGGLSGKFVLLGTQSGAGLIGVGAFMVLFGVYQLARRNSDKGDGIQ